MDDARFWKILERANSEGGGESEAVAQGVYERIVALPAAEIESFTTILRTKVAAAYTWKLWGAAYLMNGGCSDDGFEYFRGWLVTQGQKIYEAALADPDSLVDVRDLESDHECEDLLYVPMQAYEAVTGKEFPIPTGSTRAAIPSGDKWDFDDQEATAQQLPRLARKYGP
jgi:hypothetical protein